MKELTKEYLEELIAAHGCRLVQRGKEVVENEHVFGYFYDDALLTTAVVSEAILTAYFFNKAIAEVPSLISSNADFRVRPLPASFGQTSLSNAEQSHNKREWGALCHDIENMWACVEDENAPPNNMLMRLTIIIGFKKLLCWNCLTAITVVSAMQLGSNKPHDNLLLKIVCPCCNQTLYHLIKRAPVDPEGVMAFAKWDEFRKKVSKCQQAVSNGIVLALSGYREDSIRTSCDMAVKQIHLFEKARLPCYFCKSQFTIEDGVDRTGPKPSGAYYSVACPTCKEVLYASAISFAGPSQNG